MVISDHATLPYLFYFSLSSIGRSECAKLYIKLAQKLAKGWERDGYKHKPLHELYMQMARAHETNFPHPPPGFNFQACSPGQNSLRASKNRTPAIDSGWLSQLNHSAVGHLHGCTCSYHGTSQRKLFIYS